MSRFILLCAIVACAQAANFDVLIRDARIVDGSGNPWYRADVGIRDGRIAKVGSLSKETAYRVIDAAGRVLAPGFIDVHTHVETSLEKVPRADNLILDGVTSIVTGNCGGSRLNLGEWFTGLEKLGLGVNVASLIGHNTVRREVMGTANRPATPDEILRMQQLVDKAMQEGAVGFSTGLIYIPGTYSKPEEVIALGQAAGKHGGVYASHMRDEGAKIAEAIEEAAAVGIAGNMPVQISHFKIDNKRLWGSSGKSIELVENYRQKGLDMVVDQYPYDHSSTNLGIRLPSWALADGRDQVLERLKDPETRAKIIAEMETLNRDLGHDDYSYATVARFEDDRSYEGRTITEIAAMQGNPKNIRGEIETILDLYSRGGPVQMVYHSMGDEDIERIMRYPNTAIARDAGVAEFGTGMPHPRTYGSNTRVLAEFVRKRKVLTLEDAIRRMTSLPARTFRFRDRGLVVAGYVADLVLFDPERVQDKATYANPHQYSEGMDFVFVNGRAVVEDGKPTDLRPGRILRP
jgi:N-acyl-D-amino-acid deacylase